MQDSKSDRVCPTRRIDEANQGNALEPIKGCVGATIFLVHASTLESQLALRSEC
jgi:hypothetical protein